MALKQNDKHKRGFASLSAERRREVAASGGRAAHALGTAHKFTPEQGKEAGKRGGKIRAERLKTKGVTNDNIISN